MLRVKEGRIEPLLLHVDLLGCVLLRLEFLERMQDAVTRVDTDRVLVHGLLRCLFGAWAQFQERVS